MHSRSRRRRLARSFVAVSIVAALALASVACSSDADSDPDPDGATATTAAAPASTTVAPSTAAPAPTAAPTTTPPVVASFATPAAAGTALFSAWTKGDRAGAGALNLAPPTELDKLFAAAPLREAKNRGCDDGEFDAASCFFGNGQGGVNVSLAPAPGGWAIATIDPFG